MAFGSVELAVVRRALRPAATSAFLWAFEAKATNVNPGCYFCRLRGLAESGSALAGSVGSVAFLTKLKILN